LAAWLAGAVAAALLHSSGLVTVAVVGLVEAGALGFPAALGAVLGANVGTTVTAQVLSLSTKSAGWGLCLGGACLWVASLGLRGHGGGLDGIGRALGGAGLLFLGLEAIGDGFAGVPGWVPGWLAAVAGRPILGTLAGAALTGVLQSSTVFIGLVMGLAGQGLLGLEGAVHLVLGGNIGSCVPGVVAGAAAGLAGWWVGLINLAFNVAGAALVLPFTPLFVRVVEGTAGAITRQVANAHALFNLVTGVAALPLAWPVGRWLESTIRRAAENGTGNPRAPGVPGGAKRR
jgi:phosphate:Na+ symporter